MVPGVIDTSQPQIILLEGYFQLSTTTDHGDADNKWM
jgi:hypothetical protein